MSPERNAVQAISDLVVAGGGCFGGHHTRQLVKAIRRGRLAAQRVLVVDRHADCAVAREFAGESLVEVVQGEWVAFLLDYMETARAPAAHLVPPCIGPHLALEWLSRSLSQARGPVVREERPLGEGLGLPFEQGDGGGNLFLSHAAWLCPTACYEPEVCPAIRGPRDWTMPETVRALAQGQRPDLNLALVFHTRHLAYGVATIPMGELLEARRQVLAHDGHLQRVLVATVSHCHGALGVLHVPAPMPSAVTG